MSEVARDRATVQAGTRQVPKQTSVLVFSCFDFTARRVIKSITTSDPLERTQEAMQTLRRKQSRAVIVPSAGEPG